MKNVWLVSIGFVCLMMACEDSSGDPVADPVVDPVSNTDCVGGKCDDPSERAPTITENFFSWASFYDGEFAGFAAGLNPEYAPIDGHELTIQFFDAASPEDVETVPFIYYADREHYSTATDAQARHEWTKLYVTVFGEYELDYVYLEFAIEPSGCDEFSSDTCFADFNVMGAEYFTSIRFHPGEHAGFVARASDRALALDDFEGTDFVVRITRPDSDEEPHYAALEFDGEAGEYRTGVLEDDFTSWETLDVTVAGFEGAYFIRVDFTLDARNCDGRAIYECYPDYDVETEFFDRVGIYTAQNLAVSRMVAFASADFEPEDGHELTFALSTEGSDLEEIGTMTYREDEGRYVSGVLDTDLTSFTSATLLLTGDYQNRLIRADFFFDDSNCVQEGLHICFTPNRAGQEDGMSE